MLSEKKLWKNEAHVMETMFKRCNHQVPKDYS